MSTPPRQRGWRAFVLGAVTVGAVWVALAVYRTYDSNYGRVGLAVQHLESVEQAAKDLLATDEPHDRAWRARRLRIGDDGALDVYVRWSPYPDHGGARPPEPTVISWPPSDYGIQAGRRAVIVGYSDGHAEIVSSEADWNALFAQLTAAGAGEAAEPITAP